jgi:hypothetical protein
MAELLAQQAEREASYEELDCFKQSSFRALSAGLIRFSPHSFMRLIKKSLVGWESNRSEKRVFGRAHRVACVAQRSAHPTRSRSNTVCHTGFVPAARNH